jgi:hypothetical protein
MTEAAVTDAIAAVGYPLVSHIRVL